MNWMQPLKLPDGTIEELEKKVKSESARLLIGLVAAPFFAVWAIIFEQPVGLFSSSVLLAIAVWRGMALQAVRTAYWLKLRE